MKQTKCRSLDMQVPNPTQRTTASFGPFGLCALREIRQLNWRVKLDNHRLTSGRRIGLERTEQEIGILLEFHLCQSVRNCD